MKYWEINGTDRGNMKHWETNGTDKGNMKYWKTNGTGRGNMKYWETSGADRGNMKYLETKMTCPSAILPTTCTNFTQSGLGLNKGLCGVVFILKSWFLDK
jgi:hypothetical protein